ncbi:MAG: hypothetical protein PWP44_1731 [Thermacetogenium sp.]|nr:hypothetical protein [Thermacetogenium sp.]
MFHLVEHGNQVRGASFLVGEFGGHGDLGFGINGKLGVVGLDEGLFRAQHDPGVGVGEVVLGLFFSPFSFS